MMVGEEARLRSWFVSKKKKKMSENSELDFPSEDSRSWDALDEG